MTVLSVMSLNRQGASLRHPLDLANCVRNTRPTPKGKKVRVYMQAVRNGKASGKMQSKEDPKVAMAFIFCGKEAQHQLHASTAAVLSNVGDVADQENQNMNVAGVQLPPFEYANLGLLLPAAWAAHSGLLASAGAACACLPIMAPFQIPQVSPDSWMANKRALAFHRSCVLGVYLQGGLALLKFSGGDLVGGTYLGIQAAMGAYSITPDGARMMPSYMMMCGFNGLLGIIQVFQQFQGVPLHYIPYAAILPPTISLLSCYWGWEYCRELRAIGAGMIGDGPQDTCWVKFMGGDIWPISSLSPSVETRRDDEREESFGGGTNMSRFSAFGGSGHRLGEAQN